MVTWLLLCVQMVRAPVNRSQICKMLQTPSTVNRFADDCSNAHMLHSGSHAGWLRLQRLQLDGLGLRALNVALFSLPHVHQK